MNKLSLTSHLNDWMSILRHSEVPTAYQLACGLTTIGAVAKRRLYISHGPVGKVFLNLPIILIGPTGVGKDVAINKMEQALQATKLVPILSGSTFESLVYEMWKHHQAPHVGVIFAKELASLFGKKDYQSGLVEDLTNILSSSTVFRRATKKDQIILIEPTITIAAGTTLDWLHDNMPPGTMEGGFLPRFMLVFAEEARRPVALPEDQMTVQERKEVEDATRNFNTWLTSVAQEINSWKFPRAMGIEIEAKYIYEPWYINRFKEFPKAVHGYANRMRDHTLRLAALYAISNDRFFITAEDMTFAIEFVRGMIPTIEKVLLPRNAEYRATIEIEGLLPAKRPEIYNKLMNKYSLREIDTAFSMLIKANRMELKDDKWERLDGR